MVILIHLIVKCTQNFLSRFPPPGVLCQRDCRTKLKVWNCEPNMPYTYCKFIILLVCLVSCHASNAYCMHMVILIVKFTKTSSPGSLRLAPSLLPQPPQPPRILARPPPAVRFLPSVGGAQTSALHILAERVLLPPFLPDGNQAEFRSGQERRDDR